MIENESAQPEQPEWGLVQSFDIDNGELDGISPQECFVLGYELATVTQLLEHCGEFSRPVHAANRERIEKVCGTHTCAWKLTWMHHDTSEEWMWLEVKETG